MADAFERCAQIGKAWACAYALAIYDALHWRPVRGVDLEVWRKEGLLRLQMALVIAWADLRHFLHGGPWTFWREALRQPGPALELMAVDPAWKVLMDPVPECFDHRHLDGPLRLWAYDASWSAFCCRDARVDGSMERIAIELRQRRKVKSQRCAVTV